MTFIWQMKYTKWRFIYNSQWVKEKIYKGVNGAAIFKTDKPSKSINKRLDSDDL